MKSDQLERWLFGNLGKDGLPPAPGNFLEKAPVSERASSSWAPDEEPALIEPIEMKEAAN